MAKWYEMCDQFGDPGWISYYEDGFLVDEMETSKVARYVGEDPLWVGARDFLETYREELNRVTGDG